MPNRVTVPTTNFETLSPPWSLASLDSDFLALQGALNDASLGYVTTGTDTGTANNYVIATPSYGVPSNYNQGMTVAFLPANTNGSGASTLNVSGLGVQPIQYGSVAVPAGWINAGQICVVVYTGSAFQLVPPASALTGVRFNSIGNPNFEVDQRLIHGLTANMPNAFICDRWSWAAGGTMKVTAGSQYFSAGPILIPGSNFPISSYGLTVQLTTAEASLAAGDYGQIFQSVEGPNWRELSSGGHSLSLLVNSTVAPLHFSIGIRDNPATKSWVHLCTIPTASTWTYIQIPNIASWPSGNFSPVSGSNGYTISICLGAGTTYTAPSADTWVSGVYMAAPGTDNFFANPITSSTFYCAFVQHEPGPVCTPLIDKPFSQNLDECLRYFCKSFSYGTAVGTATANGMKGLFVGNGTTAADGTVSFPKIMAKTPPGIVCYGSAGTANTCYDATNGTNVTVASYGAFNDSGFERLTAASGFTNGHLYIANYAADTGW